MGTFFTILIIAVFVNNFVVVQFLGICPFLGVSKKTNNALGMGIAVTLVMTITCLITYPIYEYILTPLGLEYLEIIVFIFVIAALVQMIERAIKRFSPALYQAMGIYLPLITTNCAVLGVAELVIDKAQRYLLDELGRSGAVRSVRRRRLYRFDSHNERPQRKDRPPQNAGRDERLPDNDDGGMLYGYGLLRIQHDRLRRIK